MTNADELIFLSWDRGIRTERIAHTHITQDDNGIEGCPACDRIDPWHMTDRYADKALNQRAGGWA